MVCSVTSHNISCGCEGKQEYLINNQLARGENAKLRYLQFLFAMLTIHQDCKAKGSHSNRVRDLRAGVRYTTSKMRCMHLF